MFSKALQTTSYNCWLLIFTYSYTFQFKLEYGNFSLNISPLLYPALNHIMVQSRIQQWGNVKWKVTRFAWKDNLNFLHNFEPVRTNSRKSPQNAFSQWSNDVFEARILITTFNNHLLPDLQLQDRKESSIKVLKKLWTFLEDYLETQLQWLQKRTESQ